MFYSIKYIMLAFLISNTLVTKIYAATVTFDPLNITVTKDEVFTIDIVGKDFEELSGGQNIDLEFDGSIVEVTNVSINSYFDFEPESGSRASVNTWEDIAFDVFFNEPAKNDIVIATVQLKSIAVGMSPLLLLDSAEFLSTDALLSPSISNAQIFVVSEVPLPASWILMISALGLFNSSRKKKFII